MLHLIRFVPNSETNADITHVIMFGYGRLEIMIRLSVKEKIANQKKESLKECSLVIRQKRLYTNVQQLESRYLCRRQ